MIYHYFCSINILVHKDFLFYINYPFLIILCSLKYKLMGVNTLSVSLTSEFAAP